MYKVRLVLIITVSCYQMLPVYCRVINQDAGAAFPPQDPGEREERLAPSNNSTAGERDEVKTGQGSIANHDPETLKITPALIREKISRKTRQLLKKLRFMYNDYEPEMDVALCYAKYFELIPGLTTTKRSAEDGTIVRDVIASLKIIGRYLVTSLDNVLHYLNSPEEGPQPESGDETSSSSGGSHVADRNAAQPVTLYEIVRGSLSALHNSVFGGNPSGGGGGTRRWLRKSVEMFNTHKLILCTRHYVLEKMWDWVDAGTALDEIK